MNLESSQKGVGWDTAWVRGIPKNWQVVRARSALQLSMRRNEDGSRGQLLSLSVSRGICFKQFVGETQIRTGEELSKYFLVDPNQLVVNPMWLMHGSLATSTVRGVISPDYRIYDIRSNLDPRFLHFLLKTREYQDLYGLLARGTTTYDRRISKDAFNDLPILVPPLSVQRAIADFLDRKSAAIDALIEKKQNLVELLNEKRTALLHKCTAGAEHVRLSTLLDQVRRPIRRLPQRTYNPVGLRSFGKGVFLKDPQEGKNLGDSSFFELREGDLVLSGIFAWEGAIAVARESVNGTIISHRFPMFRANSGCDVNYILAFLQSHRGRFILSDNSRGAAGRNRPLSLSSLLKEKVPVPPHTDQIRVAKLLLQEEALLASQERLIGLVNDYRQALITAAVTGQIDVSVAENMPEALTV